MAAYSTKLDKVTLGELGDFWISGHEEVEKLVTLLKEIGKCETCKGEGEHYQKNCSAWGDDLVSCKDCKTTGFRPEVQEALNRLAAFSLKP
jgi:hypothetical protein